MNLIWVGIAVCVLFGIALVIYIAIQGRGDTSRAAMDRVRESIAPTPQHQAAPQSEASGGRLSLPTIDRLLSGTSFTAKLMDSLSRAGWRLKPSEYVGILVGSISVGAIASTVLLQRPVAGVIGGLIGYAVPTYMLSSAAGKRKKAFEAQIPDMVLLVASALKSGYSFLKALQVVAREMSPPMSEMAKRVLDECQLGVPVEDALTRMAERAQSPDMSLVVTAVIIQSQVGGSLAEVLDSIAETIRERVQIQAEVATLTAEGRISGAVLVLMVPALAGALIALNPGYIGVLVQDPMGIRMIVGAVALQILGILVIKRMMKIDI